jgi:hypothetical protein
MNEWKDLKQKINIEVDLLEKEQNRVGDKLLDYDSYKDSFQNGIHR